MSQKNNRPPVYSFRTGMIRMKNYLSNLGHNCVPTFFLPVFQCKLCLRQSVGHKMPSRCRSHNAINIKLNIKTKNEPKRAPESRTLSRSSCFLEVSKEKMKESITVDSQSAIKWPNTVSLTSGNSCLPSRSSSRTAADRPSTSSEWRFCKNLLVYTLNCHQPGFIKGKGEIDSTVKEILQSSEGDFAWWCTQVIERNLDCINRTNRSINIETHKFVSAVLRDRIQEAQSTSKNRFHKPFLQPQVQRQIACT